MLTSITPWTLIPSSEECLEARSSKCWSIDELAVRADISPAALEAYETAGNVDLIGGPGLVRLRQAFEAEGVVFDHNGVRQLKHPASPSDDHVARAQMIRDSFMRFAELHVLNSMKASRPQA